MFLILISRILGLSAKTDTTEVGQKLCCSIGERHE